MENAHATVGSSLALLLPLLAEVALVVEVAEQDDQRDAVAKHDDVHGFGEVALGEQVVAGVEEEEQELHLARRSQDNFFFFFFATMERTLEAETLTSCRDVRYFFHHRYFCM